MFHDCACMKKVDLSNLDTSNLTKLNAMFQSCENLESINFLILRLKRLLTWIIF